MKNNNDVLFWLKTLLVKDVNDFFIQIKKCVKPNSKIINEFIQQEQIYWTITRDMRRNVIAFEDADIKKNRSIINLLSLVDELEKSDLLILYPDENIDFSAVAKNYEVENLNLRTKIDELNDELVNNNLTSEIISIYSDLNLAMIEYKHFLDRNPNRLTETELVRVWKRIIEYEHKKKKLLDILKDSPIKKISYKKKELLWENLLVIAAKKSEQQIELLEAVVDPDSDLTDDSYEYISESFNNARNIFDYTLATLEQAIT